MFERLLEEFDWNYSIDCQRSLNLRTRLQLPVNRVDCRLFLFPFSHQIYSQLLFFLNIYHIFLIATKIIKNNSDAMFRLMAIGGG